MADVVGVVLLAGCFLVAGIAAERWLMSDIRNQVEAQFTMLLKRLH